jgi:hypothetical protein
MVYGGTHRYGGGAGSNSRNCAKILTSIDSATREAIINHLGIERQRRKSGDIMAILDSTGGDWNQTMHIMLLKFIGGFDNRDATMELARRIPHATIMRERCSKLLIEALLIGTSGLLELYDDKDDYIRMVRLEYTHLAAKYSLEVMPATAWKFVNVHTNNHPVLRLAQLAASYYEQEITMSSVVRCQSLDDIYRLFSGAVSEYWLTHFIPHTTMQGAANRFGKMKSELLGINFVSQMVYAYGNYTHSEALISQATQILKEIPAEDNRYTKLWNSYAKVAVTAYDSQALIQLSREYCHRQYCHRCPLRAHIER